MQLYLRECVNLGDHLKNCDSNGCCNICGNQENGSSFPYHWQPYKDMAELISSKFSTEEFRELLELLELLDGDGNDEFLNQANIIGLERCPNLYSDEDSELSKRIILDIEERMAGQLDQLETEYERKSK